MQRNGQWRATTNLELLLNDVHPPSRIERGFFLQKSPKTPTLHPSQAPSHPSQTGPLVDARSVVSFNKASYCGSQEISSPAVRHTLVKYYQCLLRRICIRGSLFLQASKLEKGDAQDVKKELSNEDAPDAPDEAQLAEHGPPEGLKGRRAYHALGILTQVHDGVGAQALQPWEFFIIHDINDEAAYLPALQALRREIPHGPFASLFTGSPLSDGAGGAAALGADPAQKQTNREPGMNSGGGGGGMMSSQPLHWADSTEAGNTTFEGQRLSLFTRLLPAFTGVYPGMAVGIVGEPHQRSARGVLTGVLVWDLVLPYRPVLPWRVDRPLPRVPGVVAGVPTRVQFFCGPFPRGDIAGLLRAAMLQALHRTVDVLIVGGPLIQSFGETMRDGTPQLLGTFEDRLSAYVDIMEACLNEFYASRAPLPHLRVVVVPHREDVMEVPVLPRVNYALEDTPDIQFRSNPCRVSVNGVHFGVCNEDIVGVMRKGMVERWPTPEGSLRRVVETLVQSRWYVPILELPAAQVDMKYFHKMRLDYVPEQADCLPSPKSLSPERDQAAGTTEASKAHSLHVQGNSNWNILFSLDSEALQDGGPTLKEPQAVKRAKPEIKLNKTEGKSYNGKVDSHTFPSSSFPPSASLSPEFVEYMPHVIFAPSTRPQFAVVTHQGVYNSSNSIIQDESTLDDTMTATGVLVVNQGVWSQRISQQHTLCIAEVTIPDSALVVARGASVATGVTCGILRIFEAEKS